MGLILWLLIVFVFWLLYLELSPGLGGILVRPNSSGTRTFSLGGVWTLMKKPLSDGMYWYPKFWDLNIYMLWLIACIVYFLLKG